MDRIIHNMVWVETGNYNMRRHTALGGAYPKQRASVVNISVPAGQQYCGPEPGTTSSVIALQSHY